jgi:hypothetical protein
MNAMCTKSEPFGQVVEGQEEMQFFDGIDGPSKFNDPAVSHAISNRFG